jgi:hypothetical protein
MQHDGRLVLFCVLQLARRLLTIRQHDVIRTLFLIPSGERGQKVGHHLNFDDTHSLYFLCSHETQRPIHI